ncbi:efflux RND transporter periplasmic adaptor subunit [Roseivirga echinicomitans]
MNRSIVITGLVTLGIGLLIGALFLGKSPAAQLDGHEGDGHQLEQTTAGLWTCSMHPQVQQPEPGDCPFCGMDLIPMKEDGGSDNPKLLKMSNAAIQLANIQTSIIGNGNLEAGLVLNGKVKVDQRRINVQTTHFAARIENLYKNFEGEVVRRGDKIAELYSPGLVTAQKELIEAKKVESSNPILLDAARKKLHHWKLSAEQIQTIENSSKSNRTFDLLSDYDGIISKKMVNNGDHLDEGGVLLEITDLSNVWAVFEVYEKDLKNLNIGQRVDFTARSAPNKQYSGKISFIQPVLNANNRVVEVRLDINNVDGNLKPDVFLRGTVAMKPQSNELMVPKSAVLWTGERSVVYTKVIEEDNEYFMLNEVTLGNASGDFYQVKSGLSIGDEVVTNGAFTLDSESQLKGKISMMNPNKNAGESSSGFPVVTLPASKDFKSGAKAPFQKQLGAVANTYITLKDKMVEGEASSIKKEATKVKEQLSKVDMSLTNGDAHMHWMALLGPMEESLKNIEESNDRDQQRLEFINLSNALINAVESFGTDINNPLYVQFCPMANDNKGATWISREENIINPYFGDVMLTCGSVESVIRQ